MTTYQTSGVQHGKFKFAIDFKIFQKIQLTHDIDMSKFASIIAPQATEDTTSSPPSNNPSSPSRAEGSLDPPGNEGGRAGDHANVPETPKFSRADDTPPSASGGDTIKLGATAGGNEPPNQVTTQNTQQSTLGEGRYNNNLWSYGGLRNFSQSVRPSTSHTHLLPVERSSETQSIFQRSASKSLVSL